jgi:hypothetical protein
MSGPRWVREWRGSQKARRARHRWRKSWIRSVNEPQTAASKPLTIEAHSFVCQGGIDGYQGALLGQLLQQRLRFLQITRVKAFCEPAIDRSEQFASFNTSLQPRPDLGQRHCGSQFPELSLLFLRN